LSFTFLTLWASHPLQHGLYTLISRTHVMTHEILTEIFLIHHRLITKEVWGLFIGLIKIQF